MNIRQLETFYGIAQLGTFSVAAERLHTSQANVSARIRELEEELDIALFERIGRRVQLTLKARELLPHASSVVTDAARLRMAAGRIWFKASSRSVWAKRWPRSRWSRSLTNLSATIPMPKSGLKSISTFN